MKNVNTVALMYDFDKTLSTRDMQEYSFIPSVNMTAEQFWQMADGYAESNNMDNILSTMFLMVDRAKSGNVEITKETLRAQGKDVEFFNGVTDWFERINSFGASMGIKVEHYIISSGLKSIIDGTKIAKYFNYIFASDFLYDKEGVPTWPAVAINYSNKTQFLYRIHKGIMNISEHTKLNRRRKKEDIEIPFSNMIYVGDGLTDVPSMKLTRLNGGYSIGVYQDEESSRYLVSDDRVSFFVPADYTKGSQMERVVQAIIKRVSAEIEMCNLGWDREIENRP